MATALPGLTGLAYGGDYNPEQWPEEVWDEDVALMREAGVTLVSVGIFSWAAIEPAEGEYDFGWLDRVIGKLHAAGIRVGLGTPTAAPPAWFHEKYPHTRPVTRDGQVLGHGSRGICCPSSPEYAEASARIAGALARRYGDHPAVALWHVHNEYGTPVSQCYCPTSEAAFRDWLERRYQDLDGLNAAWGTSFWGQQYGSWSQVAAPRTSATVVNPAQRLDFARFSSDALLACFRRERDVLRELTPHLPVTTNFMATTCPANDYWSWRGEVDVVSNDHYLVAERPDSHVHLAMAADLSRSLAGGQPWLLLEHSTSAVNWQPRNLAKRPGELARNSLAHVARGADSVMFFQWRASRFGAEKFHSAMLPHAGTESRVWRDVVRLGADLAGLAEVAGTRVRADVAILWDWTSFWAQDLEWRPSADLDHRERVEAFYRRLWDDGVTVDFAHPGDDLSGYRVVVAPSLYLLGAAAAENLRRYVEGGGRLVVSYFSGIVDEHDAVHPGAHPGALRELLGLVVEEFRPLRAGERVRLSGGQHGDVWTEAIVPAGAQVLATYADGPAAGGPALTRHDVGDGAAWYVSTRLGAGDLASVLHPVLAEAGVPVSGAPAELEVVRRDGDGVGYLFAINHGDRDVTVPATGRELLTGRPVEGALDVPAGLVRVVRLS